MHALAVGCDVRTPYGWGCVREVADRRVCVDLDWHLDRGAIAKAFLRPEDILYSSFCCIGTPVLTLYGSGVLISFNRDTCTHTVKLKHTYYAGSAVAYLQKDALVCVLPTAVGLNTLTPYGSGVCMEVRHATEKCVIALPYGKGYFNMNCVRCPVAKVLPTVEYLSLRTRNVWVNQVKNVLMADKTKEVWGAVDKLWGSFYSGEKTLDELVAERARSMADHLAGIDSAELGASLRERAKSFVNDGKVQELVRTCQERLTALMETSSAFDDKSAVAKQQYEHLAAQAKDQLRVLTSSETSKEALQNLTQSLSALTELSSYDPMVQQLFNSLQERQKEVFTQTQKMAETRTVATLEKGAKDLRVRAGNLWKSAELDQVRSISSRVWEKLSQADVTSSKAKELFQGAQRLLSNTVSGDAGLADRLTTKLIAQLDSWGDSSGPISERLSQVTLMLQLIREGGGPNISPYSFIDEKLQQALLVILERIEKDNHVTLTGRDLLERFSKPQIFLRSFHVKTKGIAQKWRERLPDGEAKKLLRRLSKESFSVSNAVAAAVDALQSEGVHEVAVDLLGQGDKVLSTLEQWRNNETVQDCLSQLNSWDIETRVLQSIENIDTDQVLQSAETALTDAEARATMINNVKDNILDFLLKYLPSMSVPDVEGVKDDLEYVIGDLDMSGFRLKKDSVHVDIAGKHLLNSEEGDPHEILSVSAEEISASFKKLKWKYRQLYFPYMQGSGTADASIQNASIRLAFKFVRVPVNVLQEARCIAEGSLSENHAHMYEQKHKNELDEEMDLVEEVTLIDNKTTLDETVYEPVLVMTSREITLQKLSLQVEDCAFAWLINLLANLFGDAIKDYIRATLLSTLTNNASKLLNVINKFVKNYWPIVRQATGLDESKIPFATEEDVKTMLNNAMLELEARKREEMEAATLVPKDFTLTLSEDAPLGFNFDIIHGSSSSPFPILRVTSFVPNSQAVRSIGQLKRSLNLHVDLDERYLVGSTVAAVNSRKVKTHTHTPPSGDEVLEWLRSRQRPMHITFRLDDMMWRKLRNLKRKGAFTKGVDAQGGENGQGRRPLSVVKVQVVEGSLGLKLKENTSYGGAVIVSGFARGPSGEVLQAEASGRILPGMILIAVQSHVTFGVSFDDCIAILKNAPRPTDLLFVKSPDRQVLCTEMPTDMVLAQVQNHLMVTGFTPQKGPLESVSDGEWLVAELGTSNEVSVPAPINVEVGDIILSFNGQALPSHQGFKSDVATLKDAVTTGPMTLVMDRMSLKYQITIPQSQRLGAVFKRHESGRPQLSSFRSVPGFAQGCKQISIGAVLLQVERVRVEGMDVDEVWKTMASLPLPLRVYVRDLDAFMHLMRLKDGQQTLQDLLIEE